MAPHLLNDTFRRRYAAPNRCVRTPMGGDDEEEMTLSETTDLVILGGGSGGYACALRAAQLGLTVTMIAALEDIAANG